MYQRDNQTHSDRRGPDGPSRIPPEVRARHALAHIAEALTATHPDLVLDRSRHRSALGVPLTDPDLEQQRLFALGWLAWLDGDFASASDCFRQGKDARSAYWLARVRLLAGQDDAAGAFEQALRSFQGSPQATAWFVDLLWRSGRQERAAQVWKSLRVNKRVLACEEADLLESRALLAQGDLAAAEQGLREAGPSSGVLRAERLLLLSWCLFARDKAAEASARLEGAATAFFPAQALEGWRTLSHRDGLPSWEQLRAYPLSSPVRAWIEAQHRRVFGASKPEVLEALARTAGATVLVPLVRYVRACLAEDDFAAILATLPGGFLVPRCRLWLALAHFCRHESPAAELVTAFDRADTAEYRTAGLEPWRTLAALLADPATTPDRLWAAASSHAGLAACNFRRAALDLGLSRWTDAQALPLLLAWRSGEREDPALLRRLGLALLRIFLRSPHPENTTAAVLAATSTLPGLEEYSALVQQFVLGKELSRTRSGWTHPPSLSASEGLRWRSGSEVSNLASRSIPLSPATIPGRIWASAVRLAHGETDSAWRDELRELAEGARGGLARSLLAVESIQRGDRTTLARLLEPTLAWTSLSAGPPAFLRSALLALSDSGPGQEIFARWLEQWSQCSEMLAPLRIQAGLTPPQVESAEPPAGMEPVGWFLHQASIALGRADTVTALAWTERARAAGLASLEESRRSIVEAALPDLERRARAQRLADVARITDDLPAAPAALFVDLVEQMQQLPEGRDLLESSDIVQARERLAALAERAELPARLAHHLAITFGRAAAHFDDTARLESAALFWLRAWRCWLQAALSPGDAELVFEHLLGQHRSCLEGLLSRGDVSRARVPWDLVATALSQQLSGRDDPVAALLRSRLQRFRDEVADDFLLQTQEAMRHGAIPEGWRADYALGLDRLRRLLSLDRDNPRLLTALVEVCADWFVDLYDIPDVARLKVEVQRSTPFALQLARGLQRRETPAAEELKARGALSEFFKFRAFVADDPERKKALYQESLALNPANDNVRDLLGGMGGQAS